MARLHVMELSHAQTVMDDLRDALERRLSVSSIVPCPVEFTAALVRLCATQSCGKCTPCRIGLSALSNLLDDVLENRATEYTLELIERTAKTASEMTLSSTLRRTHVAMTCRGKFLVYAGVLHTLIFPRIFLW